MQPKLKRILANKLTKFCEHCTLHGAQYLQRRGHTLRAAWATVMVAGLALCAVLCHVIWEKFSVDPTVTVVESTHYSTESIPFPAIMVCETQLVYGPNTGNITHVLSSRGYNDAQIDDFFDSITEIKKREYIPPSYVKKMHSLLADLGFTLEVLHDMFKKPCDAILVSCLWRSKEYSCSDMFREVYSVVGHCCQFDMAYFSQNAPRNTTFISGKETTEGLDFTVNGQKIFANGSTTDGSLLLYIFDAQNTLTMIDSSITLSSSSYFDVDMDIYAIDSSSDVKALSLKGRKCVLPTDKGISASYYQKCISTHMLRLVAEYCKCLPFEFTAAQLSMADYQDCTWERYLCIYEILEKTHADMNTLIHTYQCYQKCDYVEYETEVDYIRTERTMESQVNNSITRTTIHYSSSTCMKYRREVLYTWDQMLANLGGIFGLCLGGSIISIIEIIWFLFDLLFTALYGITRRTKTKPKSKVAFVISKNVSTDNLKNNGRFKFVN